MLVTERMKLSLKALPRDEKLILANAYKQLAIELEEQVRETDTTQALWDRQGKNVAIRHGIPDAMIEVLQTLHEEREAIKVVAAQLNTTEGVVAFNWKSWKKEQERNTRLLRDREILKMARAGKKNAEIARRFGISRPYVSKIVTKHFRRFARYGDHSPPGSSQ